MKKQTAVPCYSDYERCMNIRKRTKLGEHVIPEDSNFCREIWEKYPEWYRKTEARIFNETAPFGSITRREEED